MSRQKRVRKARAAKKRAHRRQQLLRKLQTHGILNKTFIPFYLDVSGLDRTFIPFCRDVEGQESPDGTSN